MVPLNIQHTWPTTSNMHYRFDIMKIHTHTYWRQSLFSLSVSLCICLFVINVQAGATTVENRFVELTKLHNPTTLDIQILADSLDVSALLNNHVAFINLLTNLHHPLEGSNTDLPHSLLDELQRYNHAYLKENVAIPCVNHNGGESTCITDDIEIHMSTWIRPQSLSMPFLLYGNIAGVQFSAALEISLKSDPAGTLVTLTLFTDSTTRHRLMPILRDSVHNLKTLSNQNFDSIKVISTICELQTNLALLKSHKRMLERDLRDTAGWKSTFFRWNYTKGFIILAFAAGICICLYLSKAARLLIRKKGKSTE